MEKRLMRLVWNDNNWETPIKRKHNPSLWKDGKSNASFEKAFGFGGEDWLFNTRYNLDGVQYGYIRGVDHMSKDVEFIDILYLFTIEPETKKRLLVAKINNVEIIEGYNDEQRIIAPLLNKYREQHIEELKYAEAHFQALNKFELQANIRFSLDNVKRYGYANEMQVLEGNKYNRFTPYILDDVFESKLLQNIADPINFTFKSGKAKTVMSHTRNYKRQSGINIRLHSDITDDLYKYLLNCENVRRDNVSIETSRVGVKIVDGVVRSNMNYSLYEVKTFNTASANIREALGQLLEYAHLYEYIVIEKLVIIGPAPMSNNEMAYFIRIRGAINIRLEYWAYNINGKNIKDKFVKY